MLAPVEAAALVIIVDPSRPRPLDAALIRAAFDLTPREADVAVLLVTGHSVESAAAMLGVSLATARVHMRRLLAKTGSARQADLLLLLTRLHHPGG
jgi:DNA-binding CsgD family transcriptional regulator